MAPLDPRWHVPIRRDDVPETGLHLDLIADEEVRISLSGLAGLRTLPRLEAAIDLTREGNGLRAIGRVWATVGQTCVVSLEPIDNTVEEDFDVFFSPAAAAEEAEPNPYDGEDPPEPLVDGVADVGAIAGEFFLLGIERYPRKQGVVFTTPGSDAGTDVPSAGPFAALARLKKEDGGS